MARKTTTFIATDGRDKGKRFLITEMSAYQSEEWAARALFAVMHSGVEVPDEVLSAGFAGVAAIGIDTAVPAAWAASTATASSR